MTILNRPMNLPNETFGWLVAQVLAAETARLRAMPQSPPATSKERADDR